MNYSVIQKSQLEDGRLDAEYYQPEYLEYTERLHQLHAQPLSTLSSKIDVGFVSSMKNKFLKEGIPLLRTQNVKQFYIDLDSDVVYVPEAFHEKLKKSQVFSGYVLLARSGTIGDASFVPKDFQVANSADIILIKTKDVIPEYLTAFLNSNYGRFQIERGSSGGLQGHINLFTLEKLLVPLFSEVEQCKIKKIVLDALQLIKSSKFYYIEAEHLFLKEIGLENFEKEQGLYTVVNLSDVKSAERMDAEFFGGECERVIQKCKMYNPIKLGEVSTINKGVEPGSEAYQEEGKIFVRVSNLSKDGLTDNNQQYINEKLFDEFKKGCQPKEGEILLSKDATPGIAYVVKDPIDGLISGGIVRIGLAENFDPEYIAFCINSIVGQFQVKRDAGGSIIKHWKPEQIKNLLIPILPLPTQKKIADLVRQSHTSRKKAKELLEEAKRKVEEMIEKGG